VPRFFFHNRLDGKRKTVNVSFCEIGAMNLLMDHETWRYSSGTETCESAGGSRSVGSVESSGSCGVSSTSVTSGTSNGSILQEDTAIIHPQRVLEGLEKRTTLMMRNIPRRHTHQMLIGLLQTIVDLSEMDLVYLPICSQSGRNKGYAFISCTSGKVVIKLFKALHKQQWSEPSSGKVCEVCFSRLQGLAALSALHEFERSESRSSNGQSKTFKL